MKKMKPIQFNSTKTTTSSSSRLKQLLLGMLKSSLLSSSCNLATTIIAGTSSSRELLADTVDKPISMSCRHFNHFDNQNLDDSLFRSLSSPILTTHHHQQQNYVVTPPQKSLDCSGFRPKKGRFDDLRTMIEKERRIRRNKDGAMKEVQENEMIKKYSTKKLLSNAYGFTSSSSIELSDDEKCKLFSSEDDEEKLKDEYSEAFFSSKSFSSDSSEFYQCSKASARKSKQRYKRPQPTKQAKNYDNWGVCRGFQPLVSVNCKSLNTELSTDVKEKHKRGFAVVKRSSDPYNDFRSSMLEMIIERQIFGAEDLECLLQSYLSVNSPRHHPVIIQAFSDIWVVIFGH